MAELLLSVAEGGRADPRVVEMAVVAVAVAIAVAIAVAQPVHVVVLVVVPPSLDRQVVQVGVVDGKGGVVAVQHCTTTLNKMK